MKLSLDLTEKVAEAVQGPCILFLHPASPSVNSLHSHCSVSKPGINIHTDYRLYSPFNSFSHLVRVRAAPTPIGPKPPIPYSCYISASV